MNLIPINNPNDYFEFTTNFGNDVWVFLFTWNRTYSLFHVDVTLNGAIQIRSVAVRGGIFILDDFSRGYNFFFFGRSDPVVPEDLGTTLNLYQITTEEARAEGLIPSGNVTI